MNSTYRVVCRGSFGDSEWPFLSWLAAVARMSAARRNGWESVSIVDEKTDDVVYTCKGVGR